MGKWYRYDLMASLKILREQTQNIVMLENQQQKPLMVLDRVMNASL